ncbi:MAG: hypothetical protein PHR71_11415 [Polaromonas sp.]|nr:hypothetical protein [Polaromonas sp.]
MITRTYRIRRWTRQDFTGLQVLEQVTRVFGFAIKVSEIDREEVPGWAAIQRGALGYTDWKSRLFYEYSHLLN